MHIEVDHVVEEGELRRGGRVQQVRGVGTHQRHTTAPGLRGEPPDLVLAPGRHARDTQDEERHICHVDQPTSSCDREKSSWYL
ncbi:hypothetical protein GCM10020000_71000 [Streptomyces olivoverticillatus]